MTICVINFGPLTSKKKLQEINICVNILGQPKWSVMSSKKAICSIKINSILDSDRQSRRWANKVNSPSET